MSRQIQIRRGTAAQNDAFTGAIGEVTMDTTNKTLRVHDGETAGGIKLAKQSEIPSEQTLPDNYDFVIESQIPTAENNYTWYRKYKSGWVEQGGNFTTTGTNSYVTMPIEMKDTNYHVLAIAYYSSGNWRSIAENNYSSRTTKKFYLRAVDSTNTGVTSACSWEVKGFCE